LKAEKKANVVNYTGSWFKCSSRLYNVYK